MYRRSILSVVAATLLAGCGWSQETRDLEEVSGDDLDDETVNATEDDETPEPLPTSEPGETLIEREDDELLLPASEFLDSWANLDSWEEIDIESTNACQKFEGGQFRQTVRECEYCIIVAETEDAAIEEFETFADISGKKQPPRTREFLEEQDVDLNIGDEAVVHTKSREGSRGSEKMFMTRTRIVFRDTNVVGTVDYSERTWGTDDVDVELREARDLVDLAVRMHEFWREE
jgi:hypothetical protein